MSQQKEQSVVTAKNLGMTMETGSNHGWTHGVRLRLAILLLGAFLVLVLVCAGVFYFVRRIGNNSSSNQSGKASSSQQKSTTNRPTGLYLTGHYAAAQQLLNQDIAQTEKKSEQGKLYEQKANLAFGQGDYTNSLQYAQKAETLNPTANSANWIAQSAEQLHNNQLALKYYKLELQRLGKPVVPSDNDALKTKIASLEGIAQ